MLRGLNEVVDDEALRLRYQLRHVDAAPALSSVEVAEVNSPALSALLNFSLWVSPPPHPISSFYRP